MKVDNLLSRLKKVKRTGPETWLACCPAHDDKHPSLGIRETKDGMVLVRCYAHNCSVNAIAEATGIDLADLFPDSVEAKDMHKGFRRPFPYGDVLEALTDELDVVMIIVGDVHEHRVVSDSDWARLLTSVNRIREAVRTAHGG